MIERRRLLVTLGVLAGAGAIGWWFTPDPNALPPGGAFTLQAASGPLTLESLRGRVVLVYFGYASCPDVCPATLGLVGTALRSLTDDEQARVRVVFVSLDPERDTPATLAPYAAHFHPNALGVTATKAEIAEVAHRYGITYRMHGVESALGYVVDHTSQVAVVGPDGRLVEVLPHGTPPDAIAAAVRRHVGRASAPAATAADTVKVADAYVRALAPGQRVTAAYLTVRNPGGTAQALVRASSPVAEAVELHAVLTENGMTSMRPVDRIEVPAGGEARLEPSGNHVMLIGVAPIGPGDAIPLTLGFADGSSVTVEAVVREGT